MIQRARASEFLITAGFLAIIFCVPTAQVVVELRRGQRAQFTDVFRCAPTPANLRRYESALENQSWLRQYVRPMTQWLLFVSLKDTGSKALSGADGWMFYRPEVRYLVEGDRPDVQEANSWWVEPGNTASRRQAAFQAILEYRRQLRERGIELLVMPVPEKSSVYPDRLTRRARPISFRSPTEDLLDDLRQAGVETVDLFALFREARSRAPLPLSPSRGGEGVGGGGATDEDLYLSTDTHWTPAGARLAAGAVAERIRGSGWLPESPRKYQVASVQVARRGDIIEMMQVALSADSGTSADFFSTQAVVCSQVTDKLVGLLTPRTGEREGTFANTHLKDTPLEPTVLLLGDSFSRIYQLPEPQSLGELAGQNADSGAGSGVRESRIESRQVGRKSVRRLLPGSAGFPSLLALALQAPVDYILSDGGAATEVRQRLSVNPEILENKKVLVWEFTERDLLLGRAGWQPVPLPPKL